MDAHSTRRAAGNGRVAPSGVDRLNFPSDYKSLGRIAKSRSRSERLRWSWEYLCWEQPNKVDRVLGKPVAWFCARMIWCHAKNGPRHCRLTLRDSWALVCDYLNYQQQVRGGDA